MVTFQMKMSDNLAVKVEGENVKEAIKQLTMFNDIPSKCPRCQAPTSLKHRAYEGNDYYEAVCQGEVEHKTTLGIYKDGNGLFYKHGEQWKSYKEFSKSKGPDQPPPAGQGVGMQDWENDLNF